MTIFYLFINTGKSERFVINLDSTKKLHNKNKRYDHFSLECKNYQYICGFDNIHNILSSK